MNRFMFVKLLLAVFLLAATMSGALSQETIDSQDDVPFPPGDAPLLRMQNENITVGAVMSMVAGATRWQVVCTSEAASKRMGLWVSNMMASDLVKRVAASQGLAYRISGNTIIVMTRKEYNENYGAEKLVIHLKHAAPERAVAALHPMLSGPEAKVTALPETGAICIYDTPASLEALKKIVDEIDRPLLDVVVQLDHVAAGSVLETLRSFVSPIGKIAAEETSNQIVISDISGKAEAIRALCEQLDKRDEKDTQQFRLKFADCTAVARYLALMFSLQTGPTVSAAVAREAERDLQYAGARETGAAPQPQGAPQAAVPAPAVPNRLAAPSAAPAASRAAESAAAQGTVVADERTNSVWVTESPLRIRQIAAVVAGLDTPLETIAYRFNYSDPAEIKIDERLASVLFSPFDHYEVDPSTRRVTVTTAPERASQVMSLLEEWDARPTQVFIAGKILSVNRDILEELGVTYDVLLHEMDDKLGNEVEITGTFPPVIPPSPKASIRFGELGADDFTVLMEALESDSRTRLLSSPRVLVLDGREALLTVATEEPYTEAEISGEGNTTIESVKFKPVGVTLTVAPRISGEDSVAMAITLEVSSLQEIRNGVPVVSTSRMMSDVVVANGRPLVVGGLISDEDVETVTRVPILGSIPVLGALFRNTRTDRSQRELVLIIVPEIQGEDDGEAEPTLDELEANLDARLKPADKSSGGGTEQPDMEQ